MKMVPLLLAFLLSLAAADAQSDPPAAGIVPPEIVRIDRVQIDDDTMFVTVKNGNKQYLLSCNNKVASWIIPDPNKSYLLFNKNTRWKVPNINEFVTLMVIQNWTVTYKNGENIALVPEVGGAPNEIGLYLLIPTNVRDFYENV